MAKQQTNKQKISDSETKKSPRSKKAKTKDLSKEGKKELATRIEKPTEEKFIQLLSDLKLYKDTKTFISDFFTESERETFAKRLAVLESLQNGKSYKDIRSELGVSSATISSIAESMSSKGMQLALRKMQIEAWAEKWSEKLAKIFGY